jgi:hypothetical protein
VSAYEQDELSKVNRDWLENVAAGRPVDAQPNLARAKVELLRRDHDYAEKQEGSRRRYEDERKRCSLAVPPTSIDLAAATVGDRGSLWRCYGGCE